MTIKCFGIARDIFDGDQLEIDAGIATVSELRLHLNNTYSELSNIKSYMVAVNQEYAEDNQSLNPTDEIAIIPPVSGG